MMCPNCRNPLVAFNQNEAIQHCEFCGGTFFEENQLNRISITDVQELTKGSTNDRELIQIKMCPKDNLPMTLLREESIPHFINIHTCSTCHGLFVTAKDLLAFKRAQKAKIAFYKEWRIPLPSLQAVLVYSLAFIFVFGIFTYMKSFYQQNAPKTQAEAIVRNVRISAAGESTLVYFTTDTNYVSTLVFQNEQGIELTRVPLSTTPSEVHFGKIATIPRSEHTFFKVILVKDTQRVESSLIPFVVNVKK